VFTATFAAIIARQVAGRGPPVWLLFVVGAAATVATGVLTPAGAGGALADGLPILLFLLALFVLSQAVESSGALDHLELWLIGRARNPRDLPLLLFIGVGLVSAFVVNDALVLLGVPLLIGLAYRTRARPEALLLVLAFGVTVGSTLTPFGSPQNLLVALASGVRSPVTTFFRYLALPTALNLVLGGLYLRWAFRRDVPTDAAEFARQRAAAPPLFPPGPWGPRLRAQPVLWVFPATMIALVGGDLLHAVTSVPELPDWAVALTGAGLVLLLGSNRVHVATRVNWRILALFAGLFVVVAGAVAGGVVAGLETWLAVPGPGHTAAAIGAVTGTSLVGSQVVSNVPWVGLQIPVLQGLGYGSSTPLIWMALAGGSTLAGNVTLLGAASNLIVVDAAERRGITIRLSEFVRVGLPLVALTVGVLVGCLWLGL